MRFTAADLEVLAGEKWQQNIAGNWLGDGWQQTSRLNKEVEGNRLTDNWLGDGWHQTSCAGNWLDDGWQQTSRLNKEIVGNRLADNRLGDGWQQTSWCLSRRWMTTD
jgi:hypothetical protein